MAVATHEVTRTPKTPMAGPILLSTFKYFPAVVKERIKDESAPGWLAPPKMLYRQKMDSIKEIQNFPQPLLILHGEKDTTTPLDHGNALLKAATPEGQQGFHAIHTHPEGPHALDREFMAPHLSHFVTSVSEVSGVPDTE